MHIAQNINMTSVIDHAEKAVMIYLAPAYFRANYVHNSRVVSCIISRC